MAYVADAFMNVFHCVFVHQGFLVQFLEVLNYEVSVTSFFGMQNTGLL
jgi:hypothetical protein